MRAIEVTRQGTPVAPNVRLTDARAEPEPGVGEVRVRTEASALNHLDLWVGRGLPGIDVQWPTVGGSDGAGIVDRVGVVGSERERPRVGGRVGVGVGVCVCAGA